MFDSFDISTLEIGDVIYFHYGNNYIDKELIINIDRSDIANPTYYVVCISVGYNAYDYAYVESTLVHNIKSCAYRIVKPFAGLELI